jgi:phosphate transport system substrate-binding protein
VNRAVALVLALALGAPGRSSADVTVPASTDRLELRGAGNMMAVLQLLAESYMTQHPKTMIILGGGSAERGLRALVIGVTDMAMAVDEVPADIQRLAGASDVKLVQTCIFRDGVVPVVTADNPVTNVTLKQLRDIFRGEIKNWKDVGGHDAPIEVVSHDRGSGAYEIFKAKVLGDDAVVTPDATTATHNLAGSMSANTISYIGMNAVGKLRPLTVNGVAASIKTVRSGEYPIIRQSCLYQREPGSALAKSFIDFVYSPVGQAALLAHHTVPSPRVAR